MLALEDGRTGIVGRIHHAMADGVTAIRIAAACSGTYLRRDGRAPSEGAPETEARRPSRLQRPPSTRRRRSTASAFWSGSREPFAASFPGADTPLDQHIGSEREIAWTMVPLARLKRIGRAAGEASPSTTLSSPSSPAGSGDVRRGVAAWDSLRAQVPVYLRKGEHWRSATATRSSTSTFTLSVADPVEGVSARSTR